LVIKLVAAIARFQSYLFLGVRYPEAILVAVLCDLSFAPSDSSFAPSDLLFNLRRAIYRFLRATGLFDPSDLSFAPSDLSFVPSDLSFAPSHSCVRQRMFASQYPGSVLVCTMSVVSGFVEYQDRRSRIKDRGSRIEDRGSRIEDRGLVNRYMYFSFFTNSALKKNNYKSLYFSSLSLFKFVTTAAQAKRTVSLTVGKD